LGTSAERVAAWRSRCTGRSAHRRGWSATFGAQSGSELERFFDLALDLLVIAGLDGYLKRVNPAYVRTLGYAVDELLARPMLDVVHPDDVESVGAVLSGLLDGDDVVAFENRVICADGSVRWLQWNTRAMPERGIVFGVGRDVTERRRADADLREAQRTIEASRDELRVLADEQAALRRVAMLVAHGVPPAEVFPAVAAEVSVLFGSDVSAIVRFEDDGTVTVLGDVGGPHEPGARVTLDRGYVVDTVRETSRSARFDTDDPPAADTGTLVRSLGVRSAVASPIVVEGELWGAITAASLHGPLSPTAERRLTDFTELVATAVANAAAREQVMALVEEQAALRRVAELVAREAPQAEVFSAIAAEMERLLGADGVTLSRYEPEDEVTIVAQSGAGAAVAPAGTRLSLAGDSVAARVRRTRQAARMEDYADSPGAIAERIRDSGVHSAVGTPIVVAGELWGATITLWRAHAPPGDTEERMVQFAELLGTAIANADSRDQLTASRARLVTEADDARRRVVRDLHDGAQQRLVHTIVTLSLAQRALRDGDGSAESLVGEALRHAEAGNSELRELAHGILPAVLTHRGLAAACDALVARLNLPVRVHVPDERFPNEIEASAYFVVAEALTNVVKHSRASSAEVTASVQEAMLHLDVRDDGIGGADPNGTGLVGMRDRVTALGGQLRIESPVGEGTLVSASVPLRTG
jgi:PAS domain S-box-containing protein